MKDVKKCPKCGEPLVQPLFRNKKCPICGASLQGESKSADASRKSRPLSPSKKVKAQSATQEDIDVESGEGDENPEDMKRLDEASQVFELQKMMEDAYKAFELARDSPHIGSNPEYRKKSDITNFEIDTSSDGAWDVNAGACKPFSSNSYEIEVNIGTLLALYCCSRIHYHFLMQEMPASEYLDHLKDFALLLVQMVENDDEIQIQFAFDPLSASEFLQEFEESNNLSPVSYEETRDLLLTYYCSFIAHEMGHICLGHAGGPGYRGQRETISRNQEREADIFESSVVTSFNNILFIMGRIGADLLIASLERIGRSILLDEGKEIERGHSTHPDSEERLFNAIRDHRNDLEKDGITMELIAEWLNSIKRE